MKSDSFQWICRSLAHICLLGAGWGLSAATLGNIEQPAWQTAGPRVSQEQFLVELPVETLAKKIYVTVEIGGVPRRFLFDTGSPSMISAALVAELGLPVVGKSMGTDSHGVVIESEVVQANLELDGVVFEKVPMFAADFSSSEVAQCLLGDGILGSELLPLCAWQMDLQSSILRCASDLEQLPHIKAADRQKLSSFGYPHTPFLDIRLGRRARSLAMFDTGSAPLFVISPPDLNGAEKAGGISARTTGVGSAGTSLGGQAPCRPQQKVRLKNLSVGELKQGSVSAMRRSIAPSLIGATLLDRYVVTLDIRTGAAYLDRYSRKPMNPSSFGFALAFEDGAHVSLLWDDSPATVVGLDLGQKILSVNGVPTNSSCASIQQTLNDLAQERIELEWPGGSAVIERQ